MTIKGAATILTALLGSCAHVVLPDVPTLPRRGSHVALSGAARRSRERPTSRLAPRNPRTSRREGAL